MADVKVPTQWQVQWVVSVGWMRQFRYLTGMYERILYIPGDVVECGLGEGNTFSMLAYLAGSEEYPYPPAMAITASRLAGSERKLWGFDSFEGWPEPVEYDASPRHPQKGEWRVSEEEVRERLERSGIIRDFPSLEIKIVPGFFKDTLPTLPDRPIAFLHVDCDLYVGYRDVLTYLFPRVTKGGVVLFDEYKEFPPLPEYDYGRIEKWPGATRAIDEYFVNTRYAIRSYPINHWPGSKKYFVVKE